MVKAGPKQREYIRNSVRDEIIYNVAEGGIRTAKTTLNTAAFLVNLEQTPDEVHLAIGAEANTIKLICHQKFVQFLGPSMVSFGKYEDVSCCRILGKVILFVGGSSTSDWERFHGFDIGMILASEFDTLHENTIAEMLARIVASKRKKVFIDLNPTHPRHYCYVNYIDEWCKHTNCNYNKFNLDDNMSLTEADKEYAKSMYPVGSVFYKRFVLGQRAAAEGAIYQMPSDFLIGPKKMEFRQINAGVDIGQNKSKTVFVLTGIGKTEAVVLDVVKLDRDQSTERIIDIYKDTIARWKTEYPLLRDVYVDSECQSFIRSFDNLGLPVIVRNALKMRIKDRITYTARLIAAGKLHAFSHCKVFEDALSGAVWDGKKLNDVRLDDGTSDIDTLDAFEYSIEREFRDLLGV